jgi:hypothetical protein
MAADFDQLAVVGDIAGELRRRGLEPILIGGMALVILGSRRVTHDYDFVIAHPRDRLGQLVDLFYDRGLELVGRIDAAGDVAATIDNRTVAAARLRIDGPESAYFFNPSTRLRIDLLFDFPVAAADLARRATRTKIRSHVFEIASPADLLRLKKLASTSRSFAGDKQDIEFLKGRLSGSRSTRPRRRP